MVTPELKCHTYWVVFVAADVGVGSVQRSTFPFILLFFWEMSVN